MSEPTDRPFHKGVYILPNMLTTASLFSGFLGIMWAIQGQFESCALAILVSALFDGMDGKVARLTGSASEFGVQYDSLADLVAFGVTPAIMMYQWQLHAYGRLGLMAAFLLVVCGALRLARFNVNSSTSSKKHFIGLPIPAQGCVMATLVLFEPFAPGLWSRTCPRRPWSWPTACPSSWSAACATPPSRNTISSRPTRSAAWSP
jgi:CDP-diacylglycerol--serine O-phosphatidyltransferase